MIPYSRQSIDKNDIRHVSRVLKSNIISRGKNIQKFEKLLKKKFKSKYCAVVNNGTNALFLACKAIGLKKNDIVWTIPITFAATVNAALMCQAKIDFVDIDINSFNISIQKLKEKLSKTSRKKMPKAIMVVHLGGNPADMKEIFLLSKKYKFKVIEDASHAMGSKIDNIKIGSCKWSDLCIFSFHAVKSITTSEGGAIFMNNKLLFNEIKLQRENGLVSSIKNSGAINYNFLKPGLNFRMSEVLAALGISQLKKLQSFINYRNEIANYYKKQLKKLPLNLQKVNFKSSYHLFIVLLNKKFNKKDRDRIMYNLRKKGFYLNSHYRALHTSSYFKKKGFKHGSFPNAEFYSDRSISIPNYPGLKKRKIKLFIDNFIKELNE